MRDRGREVKARGRGALGTSAPQGYGPFLEALKTRIRAARTKAVLAVNWELVQLYWRVGRDILAQQEALGWGAGVIERLSADLRAAFPEMKGFSPRNLRYMRALAEAYPRKAILQQLAAELPWFHTCLLLDRVPDAVTREWYARQAAIHGWSRAILAAQIESGLHKRSGKALTNFRATLAPRHAAAAEQALKDPYVFDFLSLGPAAQERDLERALLVHVRDFLLELGVGFAFVGSQVHLEVGDQDYYMDLLFYHLRLRSFVVLELKVGAFKPEYAGKMNFYLSAVDAQLRRKGDAPSIGLVLCQEKNKVIVEYALRDTKKPIGVSAYRLSGRLPARLKADLPSVEALESELSRRGPRRKSAGSKLAKRTQP